MEIWVAVVPGVFMLAGITLTAAFQFRQLRHENEEQQQENELLASEDVERILSSSTLPEEARARLRESEWSDEGTLTEAVDAEVAYIKAITRAGQPVSVGSSSERTRSEEKPLEERELEVVNKWLPNSRGGRDDK